jgi:hypothetical protein
MNGTIYGQYIDESGFRLKKTSLGNMSGRHYHASNHPANKINVQAVRAAG